MDYFTFSLDPVHCSTKLSVSDYRYVLYMTPLQKTWTIPLNLEFLLQPLLYVKLNLAHLFLWDQGTDQGFDERICAISVHPPVLDCSVMYKHNHLIRHDEFKWTWVNMLCFRTLKWHGSDCRLKCSIITNYNSCLSLKSMSTSKEFYLRNVYWCYLRISY